MKKRLVLLLTLIVGLLALAVPTVVFAHQQDISTTVFYACEKPTSGEVDSLSFTQDDTLNCSTHGDFSLRVQWNVTGSQGIQGLKGDQGAPGQDGTNGTNGSSILTSSDVPATTCTTGDTDIDLSNGEVYSCVALAWTDTGHTVKGDKGDKGDPGTNGTDGKDGKPGIPFSQAVCAETGLTGSAQQENLLFCQSGIEADGGLIYKTAIAAAKVRIMVGTPIAASPSVDWGNLAITYVEFSSGFHMEYHADNVVRIYNTLNQRVF